jgi:transposase
MTPHPPIPEPLWNTVPPEAQAALLEVFGSLERRIAELEKMIAELQARLNLNSTNSSKPHSTDPPAVKLKRRPPAPPSGRSVNSRSGGARSRRQSSS